MSGKPNKSKCVSLRQSQVSILIHVWIIGLLLGTLLSLLAKDYLSAKLSVFYLLFYSTPLRFFLILLPFLLSAVAVYFSHLNWLIYLCGIRATWFAASCFFLCLSYGSAGWLARWLLMFCDSASLPLLFFYWLRLLSSSWEKRTYKHILFFAPLVVLMIIDYRILTPYAAEFGLI